MENDFIVNFNDISMYTTASDNKPSVDCTVEFFIKYVVSVCWIVYTMAL